MYSVYTLQKVCSVLGILIQADEIITTHVIHLKLNTVHSHFPRCTVIELFLQCSEHV